jgi:hypothetical protein
MVSNSGAGFLTLAVPQQVDLPWHGLQEQVAPQMQLAFDSI